MPQMSFNEAEEQRSFGAIPDGTFCKLVLAIRPGGAALPGCDPMDNGLFKASQSSDAVMLDLEFTVAAGPYAHKKLWENWTVAGGNLDEKGNSKGFNMTKSRIRALLESATGTDPKDMSPGAMAKRMLGGFKQLNGAPLYAKIALEPGGDRPGGGEYPDKNIIDRIVVPSDEEYADLVAGKEVAVKPTGRSARKPAAGQQAPAQTSMVPAWGAPPAGGATSPTPPAPAGAPPANKPAWLT